MCVEKHTFELKYMLLYYVTLYDKNKICLMFKQLYYEYFKWYFKFMAFQKIVNQVLHWSL